MADNTVFLTSEKKEALEKELRELLDTKIPQIAEQINEAKQNGDLSENAEYHAAREDMGWAQGRMQEIKQLLQNIEIITSQSNESIGIGSTIVVKQNDNKRTFTIVGAQEADPLNGKISNESPLGMAFLGKKKGDSVQVKVPAGVHVYELLDVT